MPPWQERPHGHEREDRDEDRPGGSLVVRRANHALGAEHSGHQGQDRAPEHHRDDPDQKKVLQDERALARNGWRRFHMDPSATGPERDQCSREDDARKQEGEKPRTDSADRERVHRGHHPAAHDEGAEYDEQEREDGQPEVPCPQPAARLLDLRGVQERGGREPGHEGDILDRVPAPVTAPSKDVVRPPHAKQQAGGLQAPRQKREAARVPDPCRADAARQERRARKSEWNGEGCEAREDDRRVDQHASIPQHGVEAKAIGRGDR